MKFTATLSAALLASAALAAPLTEKRRARNIARHSNPPFKPDTHEPLSLNGTVHEQYSSNWAGAVLVGSGYTAVTAQFTIPTPSAPSGSNDGTQYCASAWVGLDGDTCTSAILQTGIDFCVQDGDVSYDAWYEWYPDYAYDFSGISFSAGDNVQVTVKASSTTTGTATIENLSSGQKVTHKFTGSEQGSLCETNAEWIVEDFESGSSMVPFCDFGTVTFTNAEATDGGSTVGPSGATIMDIRQNNEVLTSSSISSDAVTVSYK